MALRFPAAKERGKPRRHSSHKIKAARCLEETQMGRLRGPGARLLVCGPPAPRRPGSTGPSCRPGEDHSPHDRSSDLSCATATPAPLNLQRREKALDKLQVDKNQMPVASRSVRTDVGPGLIAVMDGARSANLPRAQGHKPVCWVRVGAPASGSLGSAPEPGRARL